jgi:hypothetical protein
VLLNQIEEELLKEFDKLIDFYQANNPEWKRLTVTEKQYKALMRISKKVGKVYRKVGELDLKNNIYRGFEISTIQMRQRHKRKDTVDMFKEERCNQISKLMK